MNHFNGELDKQMAWTIESLEKVLGGEVAPPPFEIEEMRELEIVIEME